MGLYIGLKYLSAKHVLNTKREKGSLEVEKRADTTFTT